MRVEMKPHVARIPLNCIDKAMLALDCRDEPMVLHWVIALSGPVDPGRMRSALMAAAARHPVLRSTIRTGLLGQSREMRDVDGHDPLTVTDVVSPPTQAATPDDQSGAHYDSLLLAWLNRPLDPTTELPWRALLLRRSATQSSLVFTFRHSATTGWVPSVL